MGNPYVSDGSVVRKVVIAMAQVTVVGAVRPGVASGPLPGGLNQPAGMAVVAADLLAIPDATEQAILLARFP